MNSLSSSYKRFKPPHKIDPKKEQRKHQIKQWYSRGYLPHFDSREVLQFITFRLADSLPQSKIKELKHVRGKSTLNSSSSQLKQQLEEQLFLKAEKWLDTGMGSCALRHSSIASLVQDTLLIHNRDKYILHAWSIMPNHVHLLIKPKIELSRILQSIKSYTGREILRKNDELQLKIPGKQCWMRDYWDRYIRNENHYHDIRYYIHQNPVKARLCKKAEDWKWSSAYESQTGACRSRTNQ